MALAHRLVGRIARTYRQLRRTRTLGVRAIVCAPDGRVALVRHTYIDGWYLPGGGVDRGEGCAPALLRELAEEVALTQVAIDRVLGVYHARRERRDDHVVVYVAQVAGDHVDALMAADRREIAEVGWFAVDALPDAISPATRRRIAEFQAGSGGSGEW